jgi:hypothetical protein
MPKYEDRVSPKDGKTYCLLVKTEPGGPLNDALHRNKRSYSIKMSEVDNPPAREDGTVREVDFVEINLVDQDTVLMTSLDDLRRLGRSDSFDRDDGTKETKYYLPYPRWTVTKGDREQWLASIKAALDTL